MHRKEGRANLLNDALKPELLTGEVWCVLSYFLSTFPHSFCPAPLNFKRRHKEVWGVSEQQGKPPVRVWDSNPVCSYLPVAVVKSFWLCGLRMHILFKNSVFLSSDTYTLLLMSLLNWALSPTVQEFPWTSGWILQFSHLIYSIHFP